MLQGRERGGGAGRDCGRAARWGTAEGSLSVQATNFAAPPVRGRVLASEGG
jgi:hypothetical protein